MFFKRPITMKNFGVLGEVAFPSHKFELSNVRITDSNKKQPNFFRVASNDNFHAKVRETLSVGSEVYLGPRETAW
jgi:hypothetical protein